MMLQQLKNAYSLVLLIEYVDFWMKICVKFDIDLDVSFLTYFNKVKVKYCCINIYRWIVITNFGDILSMPADNATFNWYICEKCMIMLKSST